jgi:hypothetical protein|tara:strand:- start:152 stop:406 length:255 start_codon:yes stop_codon:yes gene_type:complete
METETQTDRYETFVSIIEHPKYKDTYIVNEKDRKKGIRISQVNSKFDANIRTDKYDPNKIFNKEFGPLGKCRPRPKNLAGGGMA